jgi:glycopeptide antibiotics resistance protein
MREWFAAIGLVVCVAAVLFATMWPAPLDQGYASAIARFLDVLHKYGVPGWFGYNKLEFSANILMFVPLGFLLALVLPTRWWWAALLICPALSGAIELTQGAALSARFATITDVIANSTGSTIGIAVATAVRGVVHARDEKVVDRALWHYAQRTEAPVLPR